MKLVKESLEDQLFELKSEDIYFQNKKEFQAMIRQTMKRFKLSKEIAIMMITRAVERAGNDI